MGSTQKIIQYCIFAIFIFTVRTWVMYHGMYTRSSLIKAVADFPTSTFESSSIPLVQLTQPKVEDPPSPCPKNTFYLSNHVLDDSMVWDGGFRRIPRIVHMHLIGQSRCADHLFVETIDAWRKINYSVFLHDEDAVTQLLWRRWDEFPQLHQVHRCVLDAARYKSELWRLLALWEYGGIYTEPDRLPHKFNAATITAEDEGFFLVNGIGLLKAGFFAVAPHHPFIFFAIHQLTQRLFDMKSVDDRFDPAFTAELAFKSALKVFVGYRKPFHIVYKPDSSPVLFVLRGSRLSNSTIRVGGRETDLHVFPPPSSPLQFSFMAATLDSTLKKNFSGQTPTIMGHDRGCDLFRFVKLLPVGPTNPNMTTAQSQHLPPYVSPKLALDYTHRRQSGGQKLKCLELMHTFDKVGGTSSAEPGV